MAPFFKGRSTDSSYLPPLTRRGDGHDAASPDGLQQPVTDRHIRLIVGRPHVCPYRIKCSEGRADIYGVTALFTLPATRTARPGEAMRARGRRLRGPPRRDRGAAGPCRTGRRKVTPPYSIPAHISESPHHIAIGFETVSNGASRLLAGLGLPESKESCLAPVGVPTIATV